MKLKLSPMNALKGNFLFEISKATLVISNSCYVFWPVVDKLDLVPLAGAGTFLLTGFIAAKWRCHQDVIFLAKPSLFK